MERPRFEVISNSLKKEQVHKMEDAPKLGSMKEYLVRLKELCPDFSDAELGSFRAVKSLFKGLSPEKRVHARNVSLRVARMFPESDVILGALLHDTQEQTPKEYAAMKKLLPQMVADYVHALSEDPVHVKDEENAPLAHMKAIFPTLPPHLKNRVILIKLADRLDNLQRRLENGKISKTYQKKSQELVSYLESELNKDDLFSLNEIELQRIKNELSQVLTPQKKRKEQWKKVV